MYIAEVYDSSECVIVLSKKQENYSFGDSEGNDNSAGFKSASSTQSRQFSLGYV